jgi:putative transposase
MLESLLLMPARSLANILFRRISPDLPTLAWARGMFGKHTLDAAFGQFFSILSHVCWKRGVYFARMDKNYTSQICPQCGTHTGKKTLDVRVHSCSACGYTTHRGVAAAQVIRDRGIVLTVPLGRFLRSGSP